jgi:serine/threonine-protein kinase
VIVTQPARIGRYRVLGLLGQGAMGIVYRGRDESLDRDVALKVMAGHAIDADSRTRFEREAKAAAKLQHQNIVTIYELGVHEGAPYMALELLEGVDLQRAIEGGLRPDPKVTLPVVLQLLAGLGHAHEHGIVHRDVKPSNIFLPRGRPAKIMDFGVARLAGGMTTAGLVVGTPNYMSPEQVRAGSLDSRSDLFSAGLILYELVTGEKAYQADSVVALMYKIAHEDADLSLIPKGGGWEGLRAVLARALHHDVDERYPDARAMIAELASVLRELGGSIDWATAADAGLLARPPKASPPEPIGGAPAAPAPASPKETPVLLYASGLAAASVLILGAAFVVSRRPTLPSATPPNEPATTVASVTTLASTPTPIASTPTTLAARPTLAPPTTAAPRPIAVSTATITSPAPATAAPTTVAPEPSYDNAALESAEDDFEKGRYATALAKAKAVLRREPGNLKAKSLVEDAEAAMVVETRIKNAREALKRGDKETALEEIKAGFAVSKTDSRLIQLWNEANQ